MLKGYLGRQALSLRRGILSLNQDRHLCQGATCSGQGLSILGARVAPYTWVATAVYLHYVVGL